MDILEFVSTTVGNIAWPAAVVYSVYIFKDEIAKLLPDLKVKHKDTELSFRKEIQEEAQQPIESGLGKVPASIPPSTGTYAKRPEPTIKIPSIEKLRTIIADQLNSYDPNEHINILIHEVAVAQIAMGFEVVFADIFDSQIKFLRLLNAKKSIKIIEAKAFYENVAQAHEILSDWDLQKWMSYLKRFKLVEDLGDTINITELGSDFLTYIDISKPGFVKPL